MSVGGSCNVCLERWLRKLKVAFNETFVPAFQLQTLIRISEVSETLEAVPFIFNAAKKKLIIKWSVTI